MTTSAHSDVRSNPSICEKVREHAYTVSDGTTATVGDGTILILTLITKRQHSTEDTVMNETTNTANETTATDTNGNETTIPEMVPPGAEESEEKRHRASPRTKAFNECLALIDTYISGWKEDNEGNREAATQIVDVLTHLRGKVETTRDAGPQAPTYNGKHYVGITPTGERVQFQANTTPTIAAHSAQFSKVVGPFRMKEGAAYVVKNGVRETDKVVFAIG